MNTVFVLFTGYPCSGKTAIAKELLKFYHNDKVVHLDGDEWRKTVAKDLSFSNEDRMKNMCMLGEVGKLFLKKGITVIASFVSPLIEHREKLREIVGNNNFIEVFVDVPFDVRVERDTKGMYKKALEGGMKNFTGVGGEYEEPKNPFHILSYKKDFSAFDQAELIFFLIANSMDKQRV